MDEIDESKDGHSEVDVPVNHQVDFKVGVSRSVTFQGPLPPPDILRQYEEVMPGFAERSFAQFEKQSAHRQEIEKMIVNAGLKSEQTGQKMAYSLAIILFILGGYALYLGLVAIGTTIIGVEGVTIVGMFIVRHKTLHSSKKDK